MEIKAKSGLDASKASALTDVLCTDIASIGNYDVIGKDDLQAMLKHITDKQLLECDDTKCLAQAGGARTEIFWSNQGQYDYDTAKSMLETGRYPYLLFCCKQAAENVHEYKLKKRGFK